MRSSSASSPSAERTMPEARPCASAPPATDTVVTYKSPSAPRSRADRAIDNGVGFLIERPLA
jgi:hypothetical protein